MTETYLVKEQIELFLASKTPEILAITGKWGVGKTFLWNKILKRQLKKGKSGYKDHAYVSLFGCNSIDQLKLSIFENSELMYGDDANSVSKAVTDVGNKIATKIQKVRGTAAETPVIGAWIKAGSGLFFSTVRNQIVCIDDFERCGSELSIRDVLGLAAFLREQRNCKIVLILNEEKLSNHLHNEFMTHFEKVVDIRLTFEPSPTDCIKIAITKQDYVSDTIRKLAEKLEIRNIRILKKIERYAYKIDEITKNSNEHIRYEALHSTCLFTWSIFGNSISPPLDFIRKKRFSPHQRHKDKEAAGGNVENEIKWRKTLENYEFTHISKLDDEIINGIKNGYFNPYIIKAIIDKKVDSTLRDEQMKRNTHAWNLFYTSFDNNENKIVQELTQSTINVISELDANNIDACIRLLKALDAKEEVQSVLIAFEKNHTGEGKHPNKVRYWKRNVLLSEAVKDPDLISLMDKKLAQEEIELTASSLISDIQLNGMSNIGPSTAEKYITFLAGLSSDELISIFQQIKSYVLHDFILFTLQGTVPSSDVSEKSKALADNAKMALEKLSSENRINSVRIEWGKYLG